MADFCDQGAALEEQHRSAALAAVRSRSAPRPANETGLCRDCGEAIAPARLKAIPWCQRCTDCQDMIERRRR